MLFKVVNRTLVTQTHQQCSEGDTVFIRNPINKLLYIRIKIAFLLYGCSVRFLSPFNSEINLNNSEKFSAYQHKTHSTSMINA
jgi:hypothetical protein